jgi:glycosyltransferase involved in cell wall biosynthesis
MVIGIDIRVLGNKVKSGIEEYTESLMPHLIREGWNIKFKLFYSSKTKNLPRYDWLKFENVELYKFNYSNSLLFFSSRFFNRPFLDKMVGGADVFFFPHFFISSLSKTCKRVTTFHDLSYIYFSDFLTFKKRIWHSFQMIPEWQAKFSDKIIVVSESTKKDLINIYKIDPARIEVIYSGVNLEEKNNFFSKNNQSKSNIEIFKKNKGLPDKFILFLGKLEPRKNIINLIKAYNKLKSNFNFNDLFLVIAGEKGWFYKDIFNEFNNSSFKNQIIFTGQINDDERPFYYKAASVFIYPSFFEGFGFPPLEAMSCGVPVITSRNSSLPEVVGNAAIIVDPHNVDEIAFWIYQIMCDLKLKNKLVTRGKERANLFNWQISARKTLKCIQDVVLK